ncbi:hypothetical protein WG904_08905 [Pedobacter sp. Du54]|uniref:hypothetical protein n=1 Tax=Pedobacter anseongensis TaxID=3133439 RepID=UPI003094ABBB
MSFLNELINSVIDEELREELHERVDIVMHKIKFMDKVPVACLSINQEIHNPLDHLIDLAGGMVVNDPMLAKVIIYFEYQTSIATLMSKAVPFLLPEWPSFAYKHIYLIDDSKVLAKEPQDWVASLEDIAEILHPGYFVFGNEGEAWINIQ